MTFRKMIVDDLKARGFDDSKISEVIDTVVGTGGYALLIDYDTAGYPASVRSEYLLAARAVASQ
jgi:hypothetical protein